MTVEVILLAAHGTDLWFRVVNRPLGQGVEPDAAAQEALGSSPDPDGVLHSTSWRYDEGRVVLTYVAMPDPDPHGARRPVGASVAHSDDNLNPSPDVDLGEVAAHACRHLAFLLATDETVAEAARAHPTLARLVRDYTPHVAGELPDVEALP